MESNNQFKKLNIILGWVVWAIASAVYLLTVEPTASFWDCGEFIATAYRLEVGHPPGAPLFMMIGRLFSMFASPQEAAYYINLVSVFSSSFTILFLFWSITHLAAKMALSNGSGWTQGKLIAVLVSGFVGGLAYTFSDTFWFSAVEAEVYAMSSMFTAMVFWAILKWESVADEPKANRWIILIAYLMGLSIGVHLLNLLAIPAIAFVYYFKKHEFSWKGLITTGILSVVILVTVQYGIIQKMISIAGMFELLFVNSFGLPFNSGALFYIALLIGLVIYGLYYTNKHQKVMWNTVLLAFTMLIIGYSSFTAILIRSSADVPMDENNPENVFSLVSYLNREQYGDRPLLFGAQVAYTKENYQYKFIGTPLDRKEPYSDGKPTYTPNEKSGKYEITDDREGSIPNYADEFKMIFPRMNSFEGRHASQYLEWSNFDGKMVRPRNAVVDPNVTYYMPTFLDNMTFFISHQVNFMYWRYFFWNFVGRQNDIQGMGNNIHGNWISGIDFIDSIFIGDQSNIPDHFKANHARNKFYFLPLILGLIGFFFHLNKNNKDTFTVFLLFFFTGLAIIIYLNQYPLQPRERDYAYAGSFYAFCIWIGLGVYALYELLSSKMPATVASGLATVLSLSVPTIMATEGWDDHDRSGRYTARDFAKAYLDSCAPNAVLFTNGDNDTFPLWYLQEVEGYRTDVRVVNLSLLNTDWYINQMRRAAYDAGPVPFNMPREKYTQGTRDYLPVVEQIKDKHINLKDVMAFVTDDSKRQRMGNGKMMNYFPTNRFSLPVDSAKVVANGTVPAKLASKIVDEVQFKVPKSYIMKNDMMILDLIAHTNWDTPVYFAITTGADSYIGLQKYFQLEGLTYRLIPVEATSNDGQSGTVNTDIMYDNLMNKFSFGGIETGAIYLEENNRRMCMNFRNNFSRLADALIAEGKTEKAVEVLDRCVEVMPESSIPYDYFILPVVESYYSAGEFDKANAIAQKLLTMYSQECEYFLGLDQNYYNGVRTYSQQAISVLYGLKMLMYDTYKIPELGDQANDAFNRFQQVYMNK